jgi:LuxR family transcriptional regulator, positive regulator of biofilm formation
MKSKFTSREHQIVALIAKATLRKNIASQLEISIHTVDTHIQSIHKKTNTTTIAELLLFVAAEKVYLV